MSENKEVKKIEEKDLEKAYGGINNKDKLMSYILQENMAGKSLNQIFRVVLCMPANLDYLDVTYDENGKPVEATGVEELMNFTEAYYNSLIFVEPKEPEETK